MTSSWDEAIAEAKSNLGYYPNEYVSDWQSVVDEAKSILSYEREQEYLEFCDDAYYSYQERLKSPKWKEIRKKVL